MPFQSLITDVPGVRVGQSDDAQLVSGVTVVLFDQPAVASVAVLGGAAATRDIDCLRPDATVPTIDAIVLSGGSGFGLDAASGVQAWLREAGRGFVVGSAVVPVVPSAICFDLNNGGDKGWGRYPPYRDLGYQAAVSTSDDMALGTVGAGFGASTVTLKGGVGSASAVTSGGFRVGALAVVNALGSATVGAGPHFWAAPFEQNQEFGGLGLPATFAEADIRPRWKGQIEPATTLGIIATDAVLTKAEALRLALAAHDGLARALRVTHAAMDGDTVFAASTGLCGIRPDLAGHIELGVTSADCLARAIARAVYEAVEPPRWAGPPAWRNQFRA